MEIKSVDHHPSQQDMHRYDGSNWRKFELPNGSTVVLTSRGLELLNYNPELHSQLNKYKDEATLGISKLGPVLQDVRRSFRSGGNSEVYKVADREILIKEADKNSKAPLWDALSRMDYLYNICLQNLGPYVGVPDHYGLFIPANSNYEFLMMQKINSGMTVRDVMRKRVSVEDSVRDQVEQDFLSLKPKVLKAIQIAQEHHKIPHRNLLPDWSDENVLVDFTTRPGNKPYKLWIIDQ